MKNQVYKLAVALTVFDELTSDTPPRFVPWKKELRTCRTLTQKVLDGFLDKLDEDAHYHLVAMIKRECRKLDSFREPDKRTVTISEADLQNLIGDTYSECQTCLKTPGEMKVCPKRRVLKRLQISGLNDEICRCMTNG